MLQLQSIRGSIIKNLEKTVWLTTCTNFSQPSYLPNDKQVEMIWVVWMRMVKLTTNCRSRKTISNPKQYTESDDSR